MTAAHRGKDAGDAFWRFSLALYARPGVAAALLALQDRASADVNLILFALWLGLQGRGLGAGDLARVAAAAADPTEVTASLRALRRGLRGSADRGGEALRRRLLVVELAGEKEVQYRLARGAAHSEQMQSADPIAAADANLARYLGVEAGSPEADLLRRTVRELSRRA